MPIRSTGVRDNNPHSGGYRYLLLIFIINGGEIMKKRVTAVILTAALAVASLAGCGNTATSEPAVEATGSTVTAATEAAESTSKRIRQLQ